METMMTAVQRISLILSTLVIICCKASDTIEPHDINNIQSWSLRGTEWDNRKLQRQLDPCLLVKVEVEYEPIKNPDGTFVEEAQVEDPIRCELSDADAERANGQYFVPIVGVESNEFDHIESGVSMLVAEGAVIMDGALQVPQGAAIQIGSIDDVTFDDGSAGEGIMRWRSLRMKERRRLRRTGNKKVLVVRADALDTETTGSIIDISDSIFGTFQDKVNLRSQYDACSYGQLTFEPYEGSGVISVDIDTNLKGLDKFKVEGVMTNAATSYLGGGSLNEQVDHVMLCMPPGTGNWIAYAYVNSWLSVFNDAWCQKLSTQVHEVGHNMGLAHSGRDGLSYGDKSGMMGYSYFEDDSPQQCFNPAKSYQTGWYDNAVVELDPENQGTWFGNVVGVADYDIDSNDQNMIIHIRRQELADLYIGYNRAKGVNAEVKQQGDKVTIVEKSQGYQTSWFVAGLHPRGTKTYTFSNFENSGKNLIVDFSAYGGGGNIDEAFVSIYFDDCIYPQCCKGKMCASPTQPPVTKPPTALPTPSPTNKPTPNPTPQPTNPPTTTKTILTDVDITEPILGEMLPNPSSEQDEYVVIINPGNGSINLGSYRVCIQNGRRGAKTCQELDDHELGPNGSFMICRNRNRVPSGRICHQVETQLNFKDRRKQFVSLLRVPTSDEGGTGRSFVQVDAARIPKPRLNPNKLFIRKDGRNNDHCQSCWYYTS